MRAHGESDGRELAGIGPLRQIWLGSSVDQRLVVEVQWLVFELGTHRRRGTLEGVLQRAVALLSEPITISWRAFDHSLGAMLGGSTFEAYDGGGEQGEGSESH